MANVATNWSSKEPKDMSDDELKTARKEIADALNTAQLETGVLGLGLNHITAEVGERFGFDIPGYPNRANLPPYSTEDIAKRFPNG